MEPIGIGLRPITMRTIRMIDAELRVVAAYRAACAADGDPVRSTTAVDQLLDEQLRADLGRPGERAAPGR